jgi:chemotaxis protein histidine kinase CheA
MREAFIRLRSEFLEICKGRIEELQSQMAVLQSDAEGAERVAALEAMRREAHTIAGSSGTYGYADVSRSARALEEFCNSIASCEEGRFGDATLAELREIYGNLLSDADRMLADPEIGIVPF